MINMDFLQNLRMKQLFPVNPIADAPSPQPIQNIDNTGTTGEPYDVASRMAQIYHPETSASDRYNSMIENPPEYENPSFLRTIAASLTALGPGGQNEAHKVMDYHNIENENDWKNLIGPAQHAADLERQNNVNERTLAHQTVSDELKSRAENDKNKQNEELNKIRVSRANVYKFKAEHPNMKLIFAPGGNVVAQDPNNPGHVITLTDDDGNAIKSGKLSDTDKANLTEQNAEKLEAAKQPNREALAETRGWQLGSIPDPNDPSKQIGVKINQITGDIVPIKFGEQNPVFTKSGTASSTGAAANVGLQKVQNQARETLAVIDQILDPKTDKLTESASDAVGPNRLLLGQYIPGTKTKRGDVAINTLKSRMIVDLIGEMKAQSKTGATGFGALNLRELEVLQTAASQLDPQLDAESFTNEVKRIKEKLLKILQPADGMSNTKVPAPNAPLTPADVKRLRDKYSVPGVQ